MACNNCKYLHCGNSITVGTTEVTIAFADTPVNIADKTPFCFRICTAIPSSAASLPVVLTVNGVATALWDKYGNPVIGAQLRTKRLYKGYYGATTPHVIAYNFPNKQGI